MTRPIVQSKPNEKKLLQSTWTWLNRLLDEKPHKYLQSIQNGSKEVCSKSADIVHRTRWNTHTHVCVWGNANVKKKCVQEALTLKTFSPGWEIIKPDLLCAPKVLFFFFSSFRIALDDFLVGWQRYDQELMDVNNALLFVHNGMNV